MIKQSYKTLDKIEKKTSDIIVKIININTRKIIMIFALYYLLAISISLIEMRYMK